MQAPSSEAELTALVIATKDQDAFGELVRRNMGVVRGMLMRLTRDRSRADDIAQEAFLHAFERIDQFRGTGTFRSWLCQVAYSRFLMAARRSKSDIRLKEAASAAVDEADRSVRENLSLSLDLDQALSQLGERERLSVILCYACELSHAEASSIMNIPLGTVKSDVARGAARLRKFLTEYGVK